MTKTVKILKIARPKRIRGISWERPIVICTDGACEDRVSIGATICLPDGRRECSGAILTEQTVETFKVRLDQKQVIGQAEILPVIVAKLTWQHYLKGKKGLIFIDNEAARLGL